MMNALMLAFAARQQYHAMRTTANAGYNIHMLGKYHAHGLKYSRYCKTFHELKFDAQLQPLEEALKEIDYWCKKLSIDTILPSDIVSTRLLIALADRLPVHTCSLPSEQSFDMFNDKWEFYQFCQKNNVRVPRTWLFNNIDELKEAISKNNLSYPFITKPKDGMGGYGICKIKSAEDLSLLNNINYKPILVQKLIIGQEIDISIVAHHGNIGAYSIQRNPHPKYIFLQHDDLLAQARIATESSKFHGLAHFDAMEEDGSGMIYIIECNPRVWYSINISDMCGINFVKMNIKTENLDTQNPKFIDEKQVVVGKKNILKLLLQLVKTFKISETDWNFLKYSLSDPIGKYVAFLPRFNDGNLAAGAEKSIEKQAAQLSAIAKSSPIGL